MNSAPILRHFVRGMEVVAPVIGKFDAKNAVHPEVVRLYLALSVCFLLPKAVALYRWLSGKRNTALGAQLIVSPLTSAQGKSLGKYVMEPLSEATTDSGEPEQRSWFSRIFWSILVFAFVGLGAYLFLFEGSPNSQRSSIKEFFVLVGRGGPEMWYVRSVKESIFLAFLLSVSAIIARDYLKFFYQLISRFLTRRPS